jgi:hypothetical protein
MSTCRSCDAEVIFVKSATTGRAMILDANPAKGIVRTLTADDLVLAGQMDEGDYVRARVVPVFTDHHVTCPDASAWKGKTR